MAADERLICPSEALTGGGPGVRFALDADGREQAFAIRYQGRVHAYHNRCAHVFVELDWQPGQFFDSTGLYLICATHGATYAPDSGYCVAGPCRGRQLEPVAITERDGGVYLIQSTHNHG